MAPRNRLTANTVAEGRVKRGVSKDAPGGAGPFALKRAPQNEGEVESYWLDWMWLRSTG
jgi:hypothetical protein